MTAAHPATMRLAGDSKRSLARKVNFTARTLAAFTLPPGRDEAALYDLKVPGLIWRLRAPDIAGFFFIKRVRGKGLTRVKIGGRELTVEQARNLALAMAGDAANGMTPTARREADRVSTATVGDLLRRFMEHAKVHKRTWRGDQSQIDRYLAGWLGKRLADVTQDAVGALHAKIGEQHGKFAANRLLALLSAAYNPKRAGDLWTGPNPCRGVARFKESSRDRFLKADELPRFFAALDAEEDETFRDAVKFALLSGARRSNVLAAKWIDIDLDGKTWRIPPEASKSGKVILIPLSPLAVELLKGRRKISEEKAEFVFSSYGACGHLLDPRQAWKRVLEKAGISNFRFHDIRRSLGSWMAIGGSSLPVVGRALGHSSTASTAIYARLSLDPVRAGIDAATVAMMAAGKPVKAKKRKAGK